MRTRTREVQIFNMSLIDILCGALGAFCFMMLVLLPYYKPPGKAADLQSEQNKTQDLLKELEKLKDAAKDSALAQQMAELTRQLENQIKQLQGEVNQLTAQNQQLKTENKNLMAKNETQASKLDMRRPFLAVAAAYPPQDIDLYLQSDNLSEEKKTNPPMDLTKAHQTSFWAGDIPLWWTDHGITVWMTRDAPAGVHYKVYVKLNPDSVVGWRTAAKVATMAFAERENLQLPDVALTPERFWELVGTLSVGADGKFAFKEATQAERDVEWSKLSKGTPPPAVKPTATGAPVMPFSGPAVQPSAATISPEEQERRRRLLDDARKKVEQQQQLPPPAGPSTSP